MKFVLKGNPISTNSLYQHFGNRVYMTKVGKNLKEDYCWQLYSQKKEKFTGKVSIKIDLYFGDKRIRDIDNYHKLTLDALTETGVWEDDSQAYEMIVTKGYDKENPRVELVINRLHRVCQ